MFTDSKLSGIDEAGRGALAGPLLLASCKLFEDIPGLRDSKALSEAKREELFQKIIQKSQYQILYFEAKEIDELGLSYCLRTGLLSIKRMQKGSLLFDGNTDFKAGVATLIKADSKVPCVMAASIIAKVSRDKLMRAWEAKYPNYGFSSHKGYGSAAHKKALLSLGPCPLHRRSFLKRFLRNS